MPVSFPFPPRQPPGGWAVTLPGGAAVGEVLVYATPAVVPPTGATFRWPCTETALPLVDANGSGHNLTGLGGITDTGVLRFHQPSMRSDGTGFAIDEGSGHQLEGFWTPTRPSTGFDFTMAALLGFEGGGGFGAGVYVGMNGVLRISFHRNPGTGSFSQDFALWNGTTWVLVTPPASPTAGGEFVALRVTPGGTWTCWWGNRTSTGTLPSFNPAASWQVAMALVDAGGYKFQEINAWDTFASDADVEALRLALVGV